MGWLWWLLAPLAVTSSVAVLTWFAGRPQRQPTSEQAVSSHRRFLADLGDLVDASAPAHRARISGGAYRADTSPDRQSAHYRSAREQSDQHSNDQHSTGKHSNRRGRPDKLPE